MMSRVCDLLPLMSEVIFTDTLRSPRPSGPSLVPAANRVLEPIPARKVMPTQKDGNGNTLDSCPCTSEGFYSQNLYLSVPESSYILIKALFK